MLNVKNKYIFVTWIFCVVVFSWYPDFQAYHCYTDVGNFIFDGWIPTPTKRYHVYSLRLRAPSGMIAKKYTCSDAGEEIIHAYVRLLPDNDSNIKRRLIKEIMKYRHELVINWI